MTTDTTDTYDLQMMTDEQLTLWLARAGHTPEDTRTSLQRLMLKIDRLWRQSIGKMTWEDIELKRLGYIS